MVRLLFILLFILLLNSCRKAEESLPENVESQMRIFRPEGGQITFYGDLDNTVYFPISFEDPIVELKYLPGTFPEPTELKIYLKSENIDSNLFLSQPLCHLSKQFFFQPVSNIQPAKPIQAKLFYSEVCDYTFSEFSREHGIYNDPYYSYEQTAKLFRIKLVNGYIPSKNWEIVSDCSIDTVSNTVSFEVSSFDYAYVFSTGLKKTNERFTCTSTGAHIVNLSKDTYSPVPYAYFGTGFYYSPVLHQNRMVYNDLDISSGSGVSCWIDIRFNGSASGIYSGNDLKVWFYYNSRHPFDMYDKYFMQKETEVYESTPTTQLNLYNYPPLGVAITGKLTGQIKDPSSGKTMNINMDFNKTRTK